MASLLVGVLMAFTGGCTKAKPATGGPAPPGPAALGSRPLVERTGSQFRADLARLRGRVVVVNFWASWCGPCRQEAPELQRASRQYAGKPVTFIGVDASDNKAAAGRFLEQYGITYPTVFDAKGVSGGFTATDWSVTGLPQTWLIARDGSRSGRLAGGVTAAVLRSRIDQLLAG